MDNYLKWFQHRIFERNSQTLLYCRIGDNEYLLYRIIATFKHRKGIHDKICLLLLMFVLCFSLINITHDGQGL